MSQMTIEVEKRTELGKKANRRTRAAGEVPAVVYGAGKDSLAVKLNRKTLTETLGMDLVISTPDALQKFLLAEMARWGKVVKDYTIRPD